MWDRYKKWAASEKDKSAVHFCMYANMYFNNLPNITLQQAGSVLLSLWWKDYKKEILHVWLQQKELFSFLGEELELKDFDGIKLYLNDNKIWKRSEPTEEKCPTIDIAIHFPLKANQTTNKEGYVYSLILMPDNSIMLYYADDDGTGQINEREYKIANNGNDDASISAARNFKFAMNMLAYMSCFPECVRNGVPKSYKTNVYKPKGKNIILKTADKIKVSIGSKGAIRPHYRKQYFKYLASPFYKNKRGQFVLVSGTVVNAKAKTVEMSDNQDKVMCFKEGGI